MHRANKFSLLFYSGLFWSCSSRTSIPIFFYLSVLLSLMLSAKFINILLFPVPRILMKISNTFSPKTKLSSLTLSMLMVLLTVSDDTSSVPENSPLPFQWKSCQKCWALPILLPRSWGKLPMTWDEAAGCSPRQGRLCSGALPSPVPHAHVPCWLLSSHWKVVMVGHQIYSGQGFDLYFNYFAIQNTVRM